VAGLPQAIFNGVLLITKNGRSVTYMLSYFDVLNNLDIEVAVFDRRGNYEFVNTAVVNKRNIPRTQLMKMNVHDFLKVLDFSVFDLVMEQKRRVSRVQYYRDIQNFAERVAVMTPKAAQEIHSISQGLLDFGAGEKDNAGQRRPERFDMPAGFEMQMSSGLERERIMAALAECGQYRGKTAKLLGISVRKLQYKIKEYHLSPKCRYKKESEGEDK
jgi:transcriptional regulator with PAS, ATPase and Fis domain